MIRSTRHAVALAQRRAAARGSAPGSSRRARWSARRRSAAAGRTRAPSRSSRAGACRPRAGADSRARARAGSGMPTSPSSSTARCHASPARHGAGAGAPPRRPGCPTVSTGIQRGHRLLEDHRDPRAAQRAHLALRQREQIAALEQRRWPPAIRPGGGTSRMSESAVTLLPQPDSPTSPSTSPRSSVKRDPVDGARLAGVGGERPCGDRGPRAAPSAGGARPRAAARAALDGGENERRRRARTLRSTAS